MKSLNEYINESLVNEVSVELAARAFNKATGAQKMRIGKLLQQKVERMLQDAESAGVDIAKPEPKKYQFKPANKNELFCLIKRLLKERGLEADLNDIDVSGITDMSGLFVYEDYGIGEFNGDISKWDVRNVKDMREMFYNSKFNGDISKWDVRKVQDMSRMFRGSKFGGDISKWNVSNVCYMNSMFAFNKNFKGDLSKWNVSHVYSMNDMFAYSALEDNPPAWYREDN